MTPSFSPNEAAALLAVSLSGQTLGQIDSRLAERGHTFTTSTVGKILGRLRARGLVTYTAGSGARGALYALAPGDAVDAAYDVLSAAPDPHAVSSFIGVSAPGDKP